ncbi:MAG TPA: ribonuclease H-like domain-containing protein [Chitinophagales bacterium]|nr:ribonuclease H-like domain-containing protein [Chitinophagales bacterium]
MLAHINIYGLIFIDIETVPQQPAFEQLGPAMKELWSVKHGMLKTQNETPEEGYLKRAGVYSEFAKIICISFGFFHFDKDRQKKYFRVKSYSNHDEKQLLGDFLAMLNKSFADSERFHFCGHNIREFDVPFICRRLLINGFTLPDIFDMSGKRPWEMQDVDTMQLWKFGDYKTYTSLKLLAEIFNIPTPKDDIDGKDVCRVYWSEDNLPRIVEYCQKDVVTVARLLLRLKGDQLPLSDEDVVIVK